MNAIAKYGEPAKISPLIKFSRYAFLFMGIAYGSFRSKYIQRRADRLKEVRDKRKAARLERERLEKEQFNRDQMIELEKVTGAKFI